MRLIFMVLLVITLSGCGRGKRADSPGSTAAKTGTSGFVALDNTLSGKVISINPASRYVVLNFPIGHLPHLDQRLIVWRNGMKVGLLKVTGPQKDDIIVADIVEGEAVVGDEARDK
jgi:hypothetical protein